MGREKVQEVILVALLLFESVAVRCDYILAGLANGKTSKQRFEIEKALPPGDFENRWQKSWQQRRIPRTCEEQSARDVV